MTKRMLLPQLTVLALASILLIAATFAAFAADIIASGTFKGAGGHRASGRIELLRDGATVKVVLADDFRLKDAPDPKIAFGKDGYVNGTIFTPLKKLEGAQEYAVRAGTDVSAYNEIWIWCERFDVPLAVAKLSG